MRAVAIRRATREERPGPRRESRPRPRPAPMLVVLVTLVAHQPVAPATITVDDACSLADAITSANTDTATGGCTAGSGVDQIVLTAPVTLTEELPIVTSEVLIDGQGHAISRDDAAPAFRILAFALNGDVALHNTTVSNGIAERGGGVYSDATNLDVVDSRIVGNQASLRGGGLFGAYGTFAITLVNTTVSGNHTDGDGGGLFAPYLSNVFIESSTISNNFAGDDGGGVSTDMYTTTTITNSTVSGNIALDKGGGLYNAYYSDVMTLTSTTVSGNQAPEGGGVYAFPYFGNTPAGHYTYLVLENSIVAGNTTGGNCRAQFQIDEGGNFDDDGSCLGASPIAAGVDFDAMLADNGGPTLTHALLPGSVAIDAAGDCGLAVDQRGFARTPPCDSGSVELGAAPVGGSVSLIEGHRATCLNLTTGSEVSFVLAPGATSWDCEANGLGVVAGDIVRQAVSGVSAGGAGGTVIGLAARRASCRNLTTGQSVAIDLSTGPSWDCVSADLGVSRGDRVRQDSLGAVF